MNVLAMVRKEFKVDDKRIYLMGHSMGGAGALFLGGKYANIFAAVGAEAPAAFWQTPERDPATYEGREGSRDDRARRR